MTSRSRDRGCSRALGSQEDGIGGFGEDDGGGSGAFGSGVGGSSSLDTTNSTNTNKKRGLVTMTCVAKNRKSGKLIESTTPINLDKGKMKTYESTVADTRRPVVYPLEDDIDHVGALEIVNILLDSDLVLNVSIEMGPRYYNNASWDKHLNKEQFSRVLDDGWLSASGVCLYVRYLCDVHLSKNPDMEKRFSFISPHLISHLTNHAEGRKIISDVIESHAGQDHLVLLPYNAKAHWVLVAINTRTEKLYFLDPIRDMTIAKRHGLQKVVESAMLSYRMNKSHSVRSITTLNMHKWVNIECPKSEDSNSSAIFVLLFIEEILL